MALDPRRILIFRAVARAGSVSAGARELGWTQPAVSQHIRQLERDAGGALLLRGSTGVTLTEAGERLLRYADAIAGQLSAAESELAELASGGGTVTLAAFPSAMADFVPLAIAAVREAAPGVSVRVVDSEPPEALAMVGASDVDIAIVFEYEESADDIGLERIPLGADPTRAVVPAAHPLATRERVAMRELADEHWVAGCPRCRRHLDALSEAAGFVPDVQHETDDFMAAQSFVARTGAVALLPGMALAAHERPDVVSLTLEDQAPRIVSARYRPGADRVPAIAAVLAALAAGRLDR